MAFVKHLRDGLRATFRRRVTDQELDDELADYLERCIAANARTGMSPEVARRRALVEIGSLAAARDEVRAGLWETVLETTSRDLCRAARGLVRTPGFSIGAILTLAVGTAAVTAMIMLIRAAFFAPIPFPQADQLVRVWRFDRGSVGRLDLSYPDARLLKGTVRSFDALEFSARARNVFLAAGGGRRVEGEAVSAGYFTLLGIEPAAGRLFSDDEYQSGGGGVVILSARSARNLFGSEQAAPGQQVKTQTGPLTIVGVMRAGFTGTIESDSPEIEFWVPLESYVGADRRQNALAGGIWALGRSKPGVSLTQVNSELRGLGAQMAGMYPATHAQSTYGGEPFGENWRSEFRRGAWMLFGAAGGLLLVAALNTSALLLARALERRREEAVCVALGATRARLVTRAAFETLLVVTIGGTLGAFFAHPLMVMILRQSSLKMPTYLLLRPDAVAILCVVLALAATALLAGLGPTLLSSRVPVRLALEGDGRTVAGSPGAMRMWSGILVVQVAATVVLTAGSLSLLRTWQGQLQMDLGFRARGVLRLSVFLSPEDARTPASIRSLTRRIREATAVTPGVKSLGMLSPTVPLPRATPISVRWTGMPDEVVRQGVRAGLFSADPELFHVLRVPASAGRAFGLGDDEHSAPVAIVSRSLAELMGGTEAAVGRELTAGSESVRVVGVVENVKFGGPFEDDTHRYELYRPLAQSPRSVVSLFAEVSGDTVAPVAEISRRIGAVAPASAIDWVGPIDYWLREQVGETRFLGLLFSVFGTASLFLTALGIVGLTAAGIARNRRELAIRQVLGGTAASLQLRLASKALRLAAVGAAGGVGSTVLLGRVVRSATGDLRLANPFTIVIAVTALIAAAGLAAWIPAHRVIRIHPVAALRE